MKRIIIIFLLISSATFGQFQPMIQFQRRSTGVTYEAEATALFSRISDWGSLDAAGISTRKGLMNTLIKAAKDHGWWALMDVLQIYANASSQAALLNWIGNTCNGTAVNSITFTPDHGFIAASAKYVNTNYNPYVNGVNYALNSATFGFGIEANVYGWNYCTGAYTDGTSNAMIYPFMGGGEPLCYLSGPGQYAAGPYVSSSIGFTMAIRTSLTSQTNYHNKSYHTYVSNAGSLVNLKLYMGTTNGFGNGLGGLMNVFFAGGSLTITQAGYICDDINIYLTALGAGLY